MLVPALRCRYAWPADDIVTRSLRIDDRIDRFLAVASGRSAGLDLSGREPASTVAVLGFPRSANTLLASWLSMVVRPGVAVVGGRHSHSILDLYRVTEAGVPAIVPLRDPAEACASMMVRKGQPDSERCGRRLLRAYGAWHRAATPLLDYGSVIVAPFAQITTDPTSIPGIARLGGLVDHDAMGRYGIDEVVERTRSELSNIPGQGRPEAGIPAHFMISLPDPARSAELARAREVLDRPELRDARIRADEAHREFSMAWAAHRSGRLDAATP